MNGIEHVFRNQNKDTDNGMFISTNIAGMNIDFLLDSGSTASLISNRIYYAIPEHCRPELSKVEVELYGVNGSPVQNFGMTTLILTLEDTDIEVPAIVCEMKSDAILGQDFNLKHVKTINFNQNHLITNENICIPFKIGGKAAMTCRITCAKNLKMPPRSIRNVAVDIPGCEYLDQSIMIEPSIAAISRKVVLAPQILPNKSNRPFVTLINISYEETEVHANMYVGTAQSAYDRKGPIPKKVHVRQTTTQTPDSTFPEHLKDMLNRSTGHIEENQQDILKNKMWKYEHLWAKGPDDFGRTHLTTFKINTGNAKPIRQPYRRLPLAKKEAERTEIKRMLERNIIEESSSAWASPICLVSKPDGSVRFCVDYRKLNEVTEKDAFPLPRIDDCLDALAGAEFFSTQDLCSGFWQIPLDGPEDREKTAFLTSMGLYQFTILSFGLTNAPACFQRLMQEVLRGLQWEECVLFMDDTIVPSKDFDEGMERLEHVWDRLLNAGLKLKPSKCTYFQKEIRFLGHIVSKDGVKTDPEKTSSIDNWPQPTTAKRMRSFLGLASYYRKFIKDFAIIARPLWKLCEKNVRFKWSEECQAAFDLLKQKLVNSPILAYPSVGTPYILDTDSSQTAVGAVLSQVQEGQERVIAYFSKALTDCELNYCVTRKELLAVIRALEKFHSYVYGSKTLIRTDNSAVSWALKLKAPNGQMARWLNQLGMYDLTIVHRPGTQHRNADALSRNPCVACSRIQEMDEQITQEIHLSESSNTSSEQKDIVEKPAVEPELVENCCAVETRKKLVSENAKDSEPTPGTSTQDQPDQMEESEEDKPAEEENEFTLKTSFFLPPKWTAEEFRESQLKDQNVGPILRWKEASNTRPDWKDISSESCEMKTLWTAYGRLGIEQGLLVRYFIDPDGNKMAQLIVPEILRKEILYLGHDIPTSGHLATERMVERLKRNFYWPKMTESVARYVQQCDKCTARKTPKGTKHAPLGVHLTGEPMERISMDILGPLPTTDNQNRFVLVICDLFTKWTESFPLQNQEATTIATTFVNEFICRWGVPIQILTDQGRNFESNVLKDVCKLLHIDKGRTVSYNPKSNGVVERFNRTLLNMLSTFCNQNQRDWDLYIPQLLMAYRSTKNGSTNHTPNQMVLGRNIVMPLEAISPNLTPNTEPEDTSLFVSNLQERLDKVHVAARKSLKREAGYRKRRYDLHAKKRKFTEGDLVWVHDTAPKPGISQKLAPHWKGPFLVTKRIDDLIYMVQKRANQAPKAHHIDRLMIYRGNKKLSWQIPSRHEDTC